MEHHVVTIDIHETRSNDAEHPDNQVGVVAPAEFKIRRGDTVEFRSDHPGVEIWFPRIWWTNVVAKKEDGRPLNEFAVPTSADERLVFELDEDRTRSTPLPGVKKVTPETIVRQKTIFYQVYCATINEFAVGESPPKMILEP